MGAQHRTASIAPDHSGPRRVSTAYIAGLEQKILIGDAEIAEFVRWSGEQMGGVNGLVNNAGILRDGLLAKRDGRTGKTKRLSREDWDQVLAVNLTGATMMAREVFAHLIDNETHGGVVVNISSISRYGNRGQSNYAAAKAAMAANTLTWAREMQCGYALTGSAARGLQYRELPVRG